MSAPHGAALAAPAAGAETLVPAGEAVASGSAAKGVMESFGAVLAQAMQDVNQLYQAADLDASRLAAGEPVDLHQVMVGMEKANLSFSLALQVRNKLLEAYQEIMRMNV
ncbi:MAG: flagellar hook-basal body complex protein FliE [Chloroflexi bacterium]|nr:flagellar hook-basal body complex protein FliE [Chloroflexota bacterium]